MMGRAVDTVDRNRQRAQRKRARQGSDCKKRALFYNAAIVKTLSNQRVSRFRTIQAAGAAGPIADREDASLSVAAGAGAAARRLHDGHARSDEHLYQIPLIRTRGPIGAVRWT